MKIKLLVLCLLSASNLLASGRNLYRRYEGDHEMISTEWLLTWTPWIVGGLIAAFLLFLWFVKLPYELKKDQERRQALKIRSSS